MEEWDEVLNLRWETLLHADISDEEKECMFGLAAIQCLGIACDYFRRLHSKV